MLGTVLIVILILILLGGVGGPYINPAWSYGYGAGHYGIGIVGILIIVLIILLLTGRL